MFGIMSKKARQERFQKQAEEKKAERLAIEEGWRKQDLEKLNNCRDWVVKVHHSGSEVDSFGAPMEIVVNCFITRQENLIIKTVPLDAKSITDRMSERGYPLRKIDSWTESGAYVHPLPFYGLGQ